MRNEFEEFKLHHVLFVLAAGLAVRLVWKMFDADCKGGGGDPLLSAIARGPGGRPWYFVEAYRPGARRGVERTVEVMAAMVKQAATDPVIRNTAAGIVRSCAGHQFDCEIQSLFEFVRDRIVYRRDPAGAEWVQDARRTLQAGVGDCDDKSVLLASLLSSLGHRPRLALLGYKAGKFSHVYVEVLDSKSGRWVPLDPTNERAAVGWQGRAPSRGVYEIFR